MVSTSVLVQGMTLMVLGLSSYERLIVHKSLSEIKGIQSMSVGGGNNRKLVVMPSSEGSVNGGLEKAIVLDFTKVYD
jgi:predicted RNA-binding protein Jag